MRVAQLYNNDWSHEFASLDLGVVPRHRVFGARDLEERGHSVRICRHRLPWIPWKLYQLIWVVLNQTRFDVVLAAHEAAAVPTLALARLGLIRTPTAVQTVAAVDACRRRGWRGHVTRWALAAADLLTVYASAQVEELKAELGPADRVVTFLPLGVDVEFFAPQGRERNREVLAVGTNEGKDFVTLIAALKPSTKCTIVTDDLNIDVASPAVGEKLVTFRKAVPIDELRTMYASTGVMVIPLRDASFSSGQTVLLENRALGTPVIVTDVAGVRDYSSGETVVQPGDVGALASAIERVLSGGGPHGTPSPPISSGEAAATLEHMLYELLERRV